MQKLLMAIASFAAIGSATPAIAQDVLPFDNPAYVRAPEQDALIRAAQREDALSEVRCPAQAGDRAQTAAVAGSASVRQAQSRVVCDAATSKACPATPSPNSGDAAAATPAQRKSG